MYQLYGQLAGGAHHVFISTKEAEYQDNSASTKLKLLKKTALLHSIEGRKIMTNQSQPQDGFRFNDQSIKYQ
ncbi:hypothetical protein BTN49_2824 [Candidatus Enterovibrio escicola]|uniref:Uncharacterized protein n=1 Tax=Candidatus Enterovibrio escicola TaxID=1927127 RepID=A0A2A5T088_9GAMM|nr:hypothetical protein BTN49_2824 [Candidatus Enterovibrio escacola]